MPTFMSQCLPRRGTNSSVSCDQSIWKNSNAYRWRVRSSRIQRDFAVSRRGAWGEPTVVKRPKRARRNCPMALLGVSALAADVDRFIVGAGRPPTAPGKNSQAAAGSRLEQRRRSANIKHIGEGLKRECVSRRIESEHRGFCGCRNDDLFSGCELSVPTLPKNRRLVCAARVV